MIRWKLIKDTANKLLLDAGITAPPVAIEALVKGQGALLTSAPGDDHITGFLLRTPGSAPVIGFNSNHLAVRQRFIVAHELGHLLLHAKSGLHVDRSFATSEGQKIEERIDEDEIEANRFAAEILMPEEFLRADLAGLGPLDAEHNDTIAALAERYRVSKQAMTIRLTSVDLIRM
jgi:Zn-dependent peptidase ImmA (M78 family)